MISGRTAFIAFSLVAHVAAAVGIDTIEAKKTRTATAIEITDVKKPAKKTPPPPAKIDPPKKPEPPARERRAAAAKPAEAPPPEPPPPAAAAPISDLPDFGVALSGGVDGTGIALPSGNGVSGGPRPLSAAKPAGPKKAAPLAATGPVDPCEEGAAKPKPRSVPQPLGTEAARAAGVEGKVRVQLTVDETGHVVDVKLLQGLGYGLDEAALTAARRAEFEPAVRCGKPTRATFNISMRFTL